MRRKTLVVLVLPLLLGVSSCSGKPSEAECKERWVAIEDADASIKDWEKLMKEYEAAGVFGRAAVAEAAADNLKEAQRAAIEEARELGCE